MQATHPERLNRWFLTQGSELAVQLMEQREICPRDRRKHEEQT